MSNIYIQEPSTKGKVLLETSVGDIDIELWSKECPKACRNFVQLCMEGYYNGTIFHRLVKGFIVQGGDPTGTGTGGESVYGQPFKDEFHSRLRFVRRGLVAMANAGPHDNASQFFFTLAEAPELQNKHTIFGKVTGPTLYNMLKLGEIETDADDRPLYPHKIVRTEILFNPYEDIIPRILKKTSSQAKEEEKKPKSKSKATKNFSLLSFGAEAEDDEEQTFKASKKLSGKSKSKSAHDLADDPKLSSVAMDTSKVPEHVLAKAKDESEKIRDDVKKKLKKENTADHSSIKDEVLDREAEKKKRSEEIKKEQKRIKKELKASKRKAEEDKHKPIKQPDDEPKKKEPKEEGSNQDFMKAFEMERKKFEDKQKNIKKDRKAREEQTLALLNSFKTKLNSARQLTTGYSDDEADAQADEGEEEEDAADISWMKHKLQFEDDAKRKVLDANVNDSDRYEIHDPRNPLTQRRREASKKKMKGK